MTHDDKVLALFERVLPLPPQRRLAALDLECIDDPELRQRVGRLLELAECDTGFLDRSPLDSDSPAVDSSYAAGRTVGAYRLSRRLGAGGMAEVWLAERVEGGFHQQVAIKLIALAPGRLDARFAAEREILASLSHPGIARLYDGGVAADGVAWMAMEYVQGEHLTAWCDAHDSPLEQRLDLFLQVCDAVAYAHTRLVVHRDIKPTNILVTADGHAKLLDFGIAKLLDAGAAAPADRATHTLLLSPSYAAPEQIGGELVSTATDVYALGVVLFELLTGRLPWIDQATALATAMRRLLDAEPPPPSRAATAASPIPAQALRGDLDAIVSRALRREPGQRYPDARALAEDIRRYLEHLPVQARVGARGYVARRYLRRHWRGLVLVAVVFVAMSVALVAIAWQAKKARLEARRAEAVQSFMVDLFRTNSSNQPDPVRARRTTARELLDIGARRIEAMMDDAPENKLVLLRLFGDLYDDFGLSTEQLPIRQQATALSRHLYGDNSPELAADLIEQAQITFDRDQAERLLAQARAILDRNHETRTFLRGRLLLASARNNYTSDIARTHADAVEAASILAEFPTSTELAWALHFQGITSAYAGNAKEAIAPLRRSVEVLTKAEGTSSTSLGGFYRQLGETESYAYEHAAAEADLRKAIALAQKSGKGYALVRAEATLAVALVNADRPREGLESAMKAKAAAPPQDESPEAVFLEIQALTTSSRAMVRAGELDGAVADAEAAIRLSRIAEPEGTLLSTALQRQAEALVELGRRAEAEKALDEFARINERATGARLNDFNLLLRVRMMLDQGLAEEARTTYATLKPVSGSGPRSTVRKLQRNLVEAEMDLAEGKFDTAAETASATVAAARADELAPYLSTTIAEGELLEGLARLRDGDAPGARPLLADALAIRGKLLLPKAPKIAEALLALAECERALGHRDEAARLLAQAGAIAEQHSSLSQRYRPSPDTLRMKPDPEDRS